VGRVGQGKNPCQKGDYQKLLPGTSNLPGGVFINFGNILVKVRGSGVKVRFRQGPPSGREIAIS